MRNFLFFLLLSIGVSFSSTAQKYGTSAGLRFGGEKFGLSVRQQLIKQSSVELMLDFSTTEVIATLMPKYHFPILGKGLNIYVGAGAHVGELKDFGTTYGVDAMAGLELKLPALPITISADIKPAYHIEHTDWLEFPVTVSVHYIFSKETREKRKKAREKRKRRKERREKREERRENREGFF